MHYLAGPIRAGTLLLACQWKGFLLRKPVSLGIIYFLALEANLLSLCLYLISNNEQTACSNRASTE